MEVLKYCSLVLIYFTQNSLCLLPHSRGPSFTEEPPSWLDYSNTFGAIISCTAQGNPLPDIRWLDSLNKPIVYIPGLRELLSNGSLYLPAFRSQDFNTEIHSASYKCMATNAVGSVLSRECKLRPDIAKPYQVQVHDVLVTRGNVAVLRCLTPGIGGNLLQINWYKDLSAAGAGESMIIHPGSRYTITESGALHIRDTVEEDSYSKFYCRAVHRLTGEQSISSPGRIIFSETTAAEPPRIEYSTTNVQARSGSSADLVCVAQAFPAPTYRWFKLVGDTPQEIRSGSVLASVLSFTRVQTSDSGRYVCVASNVIGEDRRELQLLVLVPLYTYIRPQYQAVDAGSGASFNCSVEGGFPGSPRKIDWLRDARPLIGGQTSKIHGGEVLVLKSVSKGDQGMYQCLAWSADENALATAELSLRATLPELHETFIEQIIQPGQFISLHCSASSNPSPRFFWLLNGAILQPRDGYIIGSYLQSNGDVISHLNITSARVHHGGMYTCLVKNMLGSAQHSAALHVYGPPTPRAPQNVTAVYGMDVYLQCPVAGFPVSSTVWQKNGATLPIHFRQNIFSNGTLLIKSVQGDANDRGEFTCTVANLQGQVATSKVYLQVMKPPEIAPFQFPANLREGNRAHVSCSITSGDLPITVTWRKDGLPLPQDNEVQEHMQEFASTLSFSHLRARHTGLYTCIISNAAASTNFTADLVIQVAPSWTVEPEDTTVIHEQSAYIHCQASGYPTPSLKWMKARADQMSHFTPLESDSDLYIAGNGSILIKSVHPIHEGHYSCEASNGIGTSITKTVFLKVNVPAFFREKSRNESEAIGQAANLVCKADGDEPIHITWVPPPKSDLQPLLHRSSPSEYHIPKLRPKHAGLYRCTAYNAYGQDEMQVRLNVKEPPRPPEFVDIRELGARWMILSWRAEERGPDATSGGSVGRYVIQFCRADLEEQWNNMTVAEGETSARIAPLAPATTYTVRLFAVNDVGVGPPSVSLTATTLHEAPSSAPTGVIAESIDSTSILVKWKPAAEDLAHNNIAGYLIEYGDTKDDWAQTRTVRGRKRFEYILHQLKEFTSYKITVKAFNSVGQGPASAPTISTTLEGVPHLPPKNVRCASVSSQILRIRWEPPPSDNCNGIIQGYKVTYRQADPKPGSPVDLDLKKTTNLETSLHSLAKARNYSVRVLAYTMAGEGVQSTPIFCATEEDVPGAPSLVKALLMTSESILITWNRPSESNGNIVKYNVYIQHGKSNVKKESVFGDKILMYEVRRLKEFQHYEFWVSASTNAGEGPFSHRVTQTPISRVPARIAMFPSKVYGSVGSRVVLQCFAVGLPAPSRSWLDPSGTVIAPDGPRRRILMDWSLSLGPLSLDLAGNYSCHADNVYGQDILVYELFVLQPPSTPTLSATSVTASGITLQWMTPTNGGSPLIGYILKYRDNKDNWKLVEIDADKQSITLYKLRCGTLYTLFLFAVNAVGKSDPSPSLTASTKGEAPKKPPVEDLILTNSTSATLFLDVWPSSSCPFKQFTVDYRQLADSEWTSLGTVNSFITIPDLEPATYYTTRISAHSEAGISTYEYVFATRSKTGELIPLELIPERSDLNFAQFYTLPILLGALIVLCLSSCACFIAKRRSRTRYKSEETDQVKSLAELENERNNDHQRLTYSPSPVRKRDSSLSAHKGSDTSAVDYEICPYATFSLPSYTVGPSLQFQTFNQRECYAGAPPSMTRHRAHSSNSPPDGLSLEIACISNQQTLPISRKTHEHHTAASSAFMTDSDSSYGGGKIHAKHELPARNQLSTNSTVFELGSSTESAEVSPEVIRKTYVKKGIMKTRSGKAGDDSCVIHV
nr:PREDICTED: Down syndrome cell adhesion molecule-like protein Dscam2 isoform X2 [Bemisia tabaci]